jgi:hypothetical protein
MNFRLRRQEASIQRLQRLLQERQRERITYPEDRHQYRIRNAISRIQEAILQELQHLEILQRQQGDAFEVCHASEVVLKEGGLTMYEAEIVVRRLRADETLTSLRLERCFSSRALTKILEEVGDSTTFKKIRFKKSRAVDECEITAALNRNSSLEHLSIYCMSPDLSGVLETMLSQSDSLKSLVLFKCDMDPFWEACLARCLQHNQTLTDIDIATPRATSEEATLTLLESIRHLPLERLGLRGFVVGETVLGTILSDFQTLELLKLDQNGIGAMGIASLASSLQNHEKLKRLDLSRNHIGDEGLRTLLQAATHLNELELKYVGMTDVGMAAFEKTLPSMTSLTSLSMREFTYSSRGIRCLIQGLQHNYSLTSVSVWPETADSLTLDLYLRANRAGRGALRREGFRLQPALWPLILERTQRYGSDVMFLFLREQAQSLFAR